MKKLSKITGLLMVLVMALAVLSPVGARAATATKLTPVGVRSDYPINAGEAVHMTIPVKVRGSYDVHVASLEALCEMLDNSGNSIGNNPLIQVKNLKLLDKASGKEIDLSFWNGFNGYTIPSYTTNPTVCLDFDVVADESAKISNNMITIKGFGYDDEAYASGNTPETGIMDLIRIAVNVIVEKTAPYLSVTAVSYDQSRMVPGSTLDMSLTVKNEGEIGILNSFMNIDFGTSGIAPDYSLGRIKIGDLAAGASKQVNVSVRVLDTAKEGVTQITASFSGKNKSGEELGPFTQELNVSVKAATKDTTASIPLLVLDTDANYSELTPGTKMDIPVKITNEGRTTAREITLSVISGVGPATGVTKDFTSDSMDISDIAPGKTVTVKVPVTVSDELASGLHEFTFEVNYKNGDYSSMPAVKMSMYLDAKAGSSGTVNYIDIHNVSQSPSNPYAGGKISVSFEITNNGNSPVKNLRVFGQGLGSTGFEPVSNEPYQIVGDLAAGATKKVSMTFKAGENIPGGANALTIGYDYQDENGTKKTDSMSIYILNVTPKKTEDSTKDVGRPKLIINDYATDNDILRAGETFNFTFSVKNTHQTKSAKNIKVTVSQSDGIFSPASGTNIFYIDEIEPGQASVQEMTLKTRPDATTGDYEVKILLEYEYDNMSDTDREKGGVSEDNIIKLRATENYRPVIENIYIDAYDGLQVGVPVDMNFEFYNMGKSTLGNVYVTVEGDFALANNSNMSYVGAVQGYGQEFVSPQVVALVEGEATGILTVHFEDSNGDEVTLSQEFTQYVQPMGGFDDGGWDMPIDDGEWIMPSDDGSDGENSGFLSKIKPWMWIAGGSVIVLAVAVPLVVRGVKKSKSKVKVEEDEDY